MKHTHVHGHIRGLPRAKLRTNGDVVLVSRKAMESLGLTFDDDGYYEGAVLDQTMPEHQKLIQLVQAFYEERERAFERREAIRAFNEEHGPRGTLQ
jgi:hypothetical protein